MYNETIVQIIPAPKGIKAVYEENGEMIRTEIICIGLTDDGGVYFLDYSNDGSIDVVNSIDNFVRVERS